MPKISIILTSYNHERFIKEAIESVLTQTFTDYELVIVDDCSTDSSWEIIQAYDDPRIIAIKNETNRRESVYHNFHRCSGQYIAVHHSDDAWLPDKLEKQVEYLDAHPETAACFTLVQIIDEEGQDYNNFGTFYNSVFDQANRSRFEWLHTFFYEGNKLCHPSIMIRKEAYLEYGLFAHGLAQIPDFIQWIRLCRNAEIYIIQEKLTRFRLRKQEENASGYRAPVLIRDSIEWHLLQNEYLRIPEEDFFKVFPEAEEYKSPKGVLIEFIFAQICLENPNSAVRLFAIEILYRLLNSLETAEKLKDIYGFTIIDFVKMTDQNDVFHVISKDRWLSCLLQIDFVDKPSIEIRKEAFLQPNRGFSFEFGLDAYDDMSAISFATLMDCSSKFRIESVLLDESETVMTPLNGAYSEDGNDFFFVLNPTYRIHGIGRKLVITGLFFATDNIEIHNIIANERTIYKELLISKNELQESLNELQNTYNELLNSRSYKTMMKLRRLAKKSGIMTVLRRLTQ